ncbi:MAG: sigma-70 family RNA polymerase sigma factor [Myxococcales bacterium]|nr:sigma-70 family RNA polymerase sigma factor [Myxococcales bacterium]MCA9698127.1 sigma-70 family RNA polymerase sigma factor [Myxococcales bacterium]
MTPEQVARALDGDRQAMRALVERLLPVVQAEVGFALMRGAAVERRDHRQDVRDFAQEVFVQLLSQGGKTLRSWDPERGRSLESFVRLVARRQVAAILRSGRRNPWAEKPMADDELEPALPAEQSGSARLDSAKRLERLVLALRERLDDRGLLLFEMLYVEERSVEEVMAATEMTRDAVYAWRSRFRKLISKLDEDDLDRPERQISAGGGQGSE